MEHITIKNVVEKTGLADLSKVEVVKLKTNKWNSEEYYIFDIENGVATLLQKYVYFRSSGEYWNDEDEKNNSYITSFAFNESDNLYTSADDNIKDLILDHVFEAESYNPEKGEVEKETITRKFYLLGLNDIKDIDAELLKCKIEKFEDEPYIYEIDKYAEWWLRTISHENDNVYTINKDGKVLLFGLITQELYFRFAVDVNLEKIETLNKN